MLAAFRASVRAALAGVTEPSLAGRFSAPFVTALVADVREDVHSDSALTEVITALVSVGLPRGRLFVVLGGDPPPVPAYRARAHALSNVLGVPVLLHDPAVPGFTAGRLTDGTKVDLDDELREAEAIVSVGAWASANGVLHGGPFLLCPGIATSSTRAAFARERASHGEAGAIRFAAEAESFAPVDLALWWTDANEVLVAGGRQAGEHVARVAGLA